MKHKLYKAEWKNLFAWHVIDEEGTEIFKGSELKCTIIAARLNQAYDTGYTNGRRDELRPGCKR